MPSEENQISNILRKLNREGIFITAQFIMDKQCVEFRNEELELFPVDILAVGKDLFQELSKLMRLLY